MPPAPLAAPLVALLAAFATVRAGMTEIAVDTSLGASRRTAKSLGYPTLPEGCLYEGRWHSDGGTVPTGEACLHCACYHGALTCRRRACAPLPDPPPHRCHVLHRKGACCPELHCPDGITLMERGGSARFENEDVITAPSSVSHACVEGGTVYAAGSAMRSSVACEHCFCLGGARRCVRPTCLPPPPGCHSRPAPGACCPQRYYCEHPVKPPEEKHPHDCKVDTKWVTEGERVISPKSDGNCSQCFCLRGSVQCQPLSCAPPLLGCKPLLRPGECCAHQYQCEHKHHGSQILKYSNNALASTRSDDRSFHTSKSKKHETTTKNTLANIYTEKNSPTLAATNNQLASTTKVKRKTSDPPPELVSEATAQNTTVVPISTTTTHQPTTVAKLIATTTTTTSTSTESTTEITSTQQPEASLRIMINGTINCTAELSSTSLPLNVTFNDTKKIQSESHPRIPLIDVNNLEDHTFSANEIITDRSVNGGFDENESFVINVTSSLVTNTSHTSMKPPMSTSTVSTVSIPTDIVETLNSSKKTKGDYDYDYTEPTLPPSLPNLKIIPFLAADAVVENEHPKKDLTYPNLEREDTFPVYYPSADSKDSAFVTRRDDLYRPTQYPVFITDKPENEQYPSLTPDVDLTNTGYSNRHTEFDSSGNEFIMSLSLSNQAPDTNKAVTPQPYTTTTFKLETPIVNMFSPPVETEGGFVPKGPTGLIDEYFAVFPSTPSGTSLPHLTTSMQLDIAKEECVSGDGRRILDGDTITLACSECTCAWGELHCSPRPCHTPAGCRRRPASKSAGDLCCGELICEEDNKTTPTPEVTTRKTNSIKTTELNNGTDDVKLESVTDRQASTSANTVRIDTPIIKEEAIIQSHSSSQEFEKIETNKTVATIKAPVSRTTEKFTTTSVTTTTTDAPVYKATTTEINNKSLEYDEEDEDEGFSFGSVLKLLLSDNYETTTTVAKRLTTTPKAPPSVKVTTTRRPRPTLPPFQPPKQTIVPFVPLPNHPYIPPKKNQNPINRIDHLVLGEATAIKRTTPHPITTTFKYEETERPTSRPTTHHILTKTKEFTKEETYTTHEPPRLPGGLSGLGPSFLKLAGCNIYGRMYRVGRIIAELSTPCQECWCTELGVQCKQLKC